jgi:hypothetical protein
VVFGKLKLCAALTAAVAAPTAAIGQEVDSRMLLIDLELCRMIFHESADFRESQLENVQGVTTDERKLRHAHDAIGRLREDRGILARMRNRVKEELESKPNADEAELTSLFFDTHLIARNALHSQAKPYYFDHDVFDMSKPKFTDALQDCHRTYVLGGMQVPAIDLEAFTEAEGD